MGLLLSFSALCSSQSKPLIRMPFGIGCDMSKGAIDSILTSKGYTTIDLLQPAGVEVYRISDLKFGDVKMAPGVEIHFYKDRLVRLCFESSCREEPKEQLESLFALSAFLKDSYKCKERKNLLKLAQKGEDLMNVILLEYSSADSISVDAFSGYRSSSLQGTNCAFFTRISYWNNQVLGQKIKDDEKSRKTTDDKTRKDIL